ncbi:DUF3857 and transglutaminase domain-containing protein [Rhodocytophaga aerolata]|uniref:DUF3857 and transglutaminase domain-containing protein n=1 Tax=Rhodocytophaga aerolata TaxID=455078 RepID=A0ABT8RDI8_9BACT|nr:DUF3857 and transglutaminase domain-containing protein [Rhodocytophaga aerolata]MDO1450168.1 DUF3857 and transglutaminase domain-containing protein [Rhodocytophaga aerolata]
MKDVRQSFRFTTQMVVEVVYKIYSQTSLKRSVEDGLITNGRMVAKFRRLVYLFLLITVASQLQAQSPPPLQWGKVNAEEGQLKVCPFDSSASAVVLSDYGRIVFGYEAVYIERHKRIKILTRKGLQEATISIPYYAKDNLEKIAFLRAQTLKLDEKGKVSSQEVSAKLIFDVNHSSSLREKRFTFPNVDEGTIVEYRYTTISKNFFTLAGWNFQSNIPTMHSELRVEKPQSLTYRILLQGNRLSQKYEKLDAQTWSLDNLHALVREPFVANYQNYAEKISFQLAIFNKTDGVPLESDNHLTYLGQRDKAKDILKTILTGNETETQRLHKIYNYVKATFRWNKSYSFFIYQNFHSFLETKQGQTAEINLFLILLLREAGLNVHPTLLSTRDQGKVYLTDKPLLSQFNHLVALAQADTKELFLDATDPFRPYSLLDKNDLNEDAFVLDKQNPRWVKIHQANFSRQITSAEVDFSNPLKPVYHFSVKYEGYEALAKRQKYAEEGKKVLAKEEISTQYQEFKQIRSEIQQMDNCDEALLIKLTYQADTASQDQAGFIYFNPVLLSEFNENPFNNEKRYLPVELDYPATYTYVLTMKIPPGYQLQEMPQSTLIKFPEDLAEFRYQISCKDNVIQLMTKVAFKSTLIPCDYYQHLREFYDQFMAKHREIIVLKKIG